MKALFFDGSVSLRNIAQPRPGPGEALIQVLLAGICGTDREILKGYSGFRGVPGHEFVGKVVECEDKTWLNRRVVGEINVACGRCSWCARGLARHCPHRSVLGIVKRDGAFAEFLALPLRNLLEVPPEISDEAATFVEPLAAAAEILDQMRLEPGTRVAVLGDGRLGLLVSQVLKHAGAEITLVGRHGWKLDLARSWGVGVLGLGEEELPAASFPAYTPFGAVDTLTDGCVGTGCTPYQEKYNYNDRLQPVMIQVGTSGSLSSVACDVYYYYSGFTAPSSCPSTAPGSGSGNNGNPMGWYHWDGDAWGGGTGVNNTTNYAYDSLNRLQWNYMAGHYSQTYNIDRYGNMVCTTGSNYCNSSLTFSATTNRISTSGYSYDAAGNLTADGTGYGTHTFQWDAEGRMVSVDGGTTATFVYNALGQRVQKTAGSNTVYYYHDAFGNLSMTRGASHVNEYLFPGNFGKYYWTGSAWETNYTHKNPLGSTQVVTRADGSYAQAEIFFPFGGVRYSGGGTQDVRYASMPERDLETQGWQDPLDPTPNRTYTSGLGRWFSPDPLAGDITNPQSLNRYAYVLNNPTSLTDPAGLSTYSVAAWWTGSCSPNGTTSGCYWMGHAESNTSDFNGLCFLAPCGPGPADDDSMPLVAPFPSVAEILEDIDAPAGAWDSPLSGDYGANLPPPGPAARGLPCDFGSCAGMPSMSNPFTAQVGGSVNINLWLFTFNFSGGFAIDLHGHVASYITTGKGVTQGGAGSIGLQGAISNADTVCGLRGPFWNGSGTFGGGGSVSADIFQGKGNGPNGTVTGGGITVGAGVGGSGSVTRTNTDVTPLGSAPCH